MPGPPLPAALQSLAWARRPIAFTEWVRRRYGPIIRLRSVLLGELVYVADPALVQEVFKGDPRRLRAGELNSLLEPVAGANSVLLLDEPEHMRMRKLLLPLFHGESFKRYGELIAEITDREVDRWPIRRPFPIRDTTQAITLDVILRAVFGIEEPARQEELRRLLPRLFEIPILMMLEPLRLDLGPRSPWGRFLRARRRVDEILYEEIRRRRARIDAADDGHRPADDILSLLLSARDEDGSHLSDAELRDELVTMLLAGHETTATALAWAFERLLRHPDKLARLRDSLAAGETEYLEAVIKETLRVRPIVMDVGRKLTAPMELGGYLIPAGFSVLPAIALIHYSSDVYPEPHEFIPERFVEDRGSPGPYSWIPFGGGVRRCLGASFAQFEMRIVIARILERAELRAPRQEPEKTKLRGVTLVPARGGEILVVRKR